MARFGHSHAGSDQVSIAYSHALFTFLKKSCHFVSFIYVYSPVVCHQIIELLRISHAVQCKQLVTETLFGSLRRGTKISNFKTGIVSVELCVTTVYTDLFTYSAK